MSGSSGKAKRDARKAPVFVPHPNDAKHVQRAFEQDAKHPERRVELTPDQLKRWAETGEWPTSSD